MLLLLVIPSLSVYQLLMRGRKPCWVKQIDDLKWRFRVQGEQDGGRYTVKQIEKDPERHCRHKAGKAESERKKIR